MSSNDPPDRDLEQRFAALFRSYSSTGGAAAGPGEAAFLMSQLNVTRGARLLCCDRSLVAFGWALAAEGCALSLIGSAAGVEEFDGAICSVTEFDSAHGKALLLQLTRSLASGSRILIEDGPAAVDPRPAPELEDFGPVVFVVVVLSPEGRRLYVWRRT